MRLLRRLLLPLALTLLVFAPGHAHAAPILVVDLGGLGPSASIQVGDTVAASIRANDVPAGADGDGLFGFGFTITFAAAGVSASAIAIDAQWTGNTSVTLGSGTIGITANRLGEASGPSGSNVALASLTLQGLTPGVYAITLSALTGPGDNVLFDGTCLDAADGNACTGQNAGFFGSGALLTVVPEPAVVLLLATALAAGGIRARR